MSNPFVAEIRAFPFNFAPKGWARCEGQLLPISQNTALFSLLGTTYGGNGTSNFALPDLSGRAALHVGRNQPGPGLSIYDLGQEGGQAGVVLQGNEMPAHTHVPLAKVQPGSTTNMHNVPQAGDYLTRFNASSTAFGTTWQSPPLSNPVTMHQSTVKEVGGTAHENRQPVQMLSYCIALQGVFPARN